jgi:hypothetical protein
MAFDTILKQSGLYTPEEYERKSEDIEAKRREAMQPYVDRAQERAKQTDAIGKRVSEVKVPDAPTLDKLPDAPKQEYKDPLQALGGMGTLLAVIGSLATRAPLTSALDSMAGAMEGFHKGDKERLELEKTNWKNNFEKSLAQNNEELSQYHAALEKANGDFSKASAEMHVIAAQNKDDSMLAALESGNYERQQQILDQRQNLGERLAQLHSTDSLRRLTIKSIYGGGLGSLPQSTVDYYAKQSLMGDNSWQVGLARGRVGQQLIAAVKDRIPQMAAELGMTPGDAVATKARREALSASLKDRQKYLGAAGQFVGNFKKQADLVEKYMAKGAADGTPVINKWIQAGRVSIAGDPDVTAFDTAIRGLAREHQRIVTGITSNAQLHVAAQETADQLLNRSMTPDQIHSTLAVMREEAQNALDSGKAETDLLESQIKTLGGGSGGKVMKFDAQGNPLQ